MIRGIGAARIQAPYFQCFNRVLAEYWEGSKLGVRGYTGLVAICCFLHGVLAVDGERKLESSLCYSYIARHFSAAPILISAQSLLLSDSCVHICKVFHAAARYLVPQFKELFASTIKQRQRSYIFLASVFT